MVNRSDGAVRTWCSSTAAWPSPQRALSMRASAGGRFRRPSPPAARPSRNRSTRRRSAGRQATHPARTGTETTRKPLDAATDTLIELGYAGARADCRRSASALGRAQAACFRRFPTRETLMRRGRRDVANRILATYAKKFESLRDREHPLVIADAPRPRACRSRLNQAWYSWRKSPSHPTNASLRKSLVPAGKRYEDKIERLARTLLPDLATKLGERFRGRRHGHRGVRRRGHSPPDHEGRATTTPAWRS